MGDRELRMYDALKRIASYMSPKKMHREAQAQYGLEPAEAIEYAYENVLAEAKSAIKGMRRPKPVRAAAELGRKS